MKSKVRLSAAAALAVVPLVLAGCGAAAGSGSGSGASGSSKPVTGGNLVIDRSNDAVSMNKTTTFDNSSIYVMEQIMEPLFTVSNDGKSVEPWLATGYTVSPNKLTYTIKLRSGVKFSNGQPMTAADVKFSIDADTATGSSGWGYINSAIKQVVAVNPSTVQIDLKYAWAPILADLSLFSQRDHPEQLRRRERDRLLQPPDRHRAVRVGRRGTRASHIKLVKNPHYWQPGKPYLNSVTFDVVPDANTRQLQLAGQPGADVDDVPRLVDLRRAEEHPQHHRHRVHRRPRSTTWPSTRRWRRSTTSTCGRRSRTRSTARRWSTPCCSATESRATRCSCQACRTTTPPAARRTTWRRPRRRWRHRQSPTGFTTTLQIASGNANESAAAQIVQSELQPLGITLNIQQLDPTAAHASLAEPTLSTWPTPSGPWTSRTRTSGPRSRWIPSGGAQSAFTFYNNPTVINLNKQAEQQIDPAKRSALYTQLQQLTSQDAFLAYLYYPPYAYATTDNVHGFFVTPLGNFHLENVYLSS